MSLSRSKALIVPSLCAVALVLGGCGGGSSSSTPAVPPNAIAVVGDMTITKAQFQSLLDRAKKNYESQKKAFPQPGTQSYEAIKDQAVRYLVQQAEYTLEAKSLGATVTDQQVDQRLEQIKKTSFGGSETKLEAALKQQGLTVDDAKQLLRDRLIQEAIYNKVTGDIKVTDQTARQYYDQNKAQFSQPETRDVRHILVKQKSLADKLYGELKHGADFAKLAKKYSQDPGSKAKGGKLTVTKGQTVPPFDKVAFSIPVDQISKPVKTQFGWHIIEALGPVKPKTVTPFDQVKAQIVQQLLSQRRQNAIDMWSRELPSRYTTKIAYAPGFKPPATTQTTTGD